MIPIPYLKGLGSFPKTAIFSLLLSVFFTAFQVNDVQAQCEADAGTLGNVQLCMGDSLAVIQATPNGDAVVPDGFLVLYVLTSGDSLIIENVSPQPAFEVAPEGAYTIHTLVFDPATIDLVDTTGIGTPTGFDVNALLIQGGGDICGSLDVPGAKFSFDNCTEVCGAFAGTLTPTTDDCLPDTARDLAAEHVAPPIVPEGYSVIYVLTSGEELTIEAVNATPEFTVDTSGLFTIHTLVYDTATLDLSVVEFGVTTGVDVINLINDNDICAALDAAGAPVNIGDCPCEAEAGTLVADSTVACLDSSLTLTATEGDAPVVPNGYSVLYVLTSSDSLVIEAVNASPEFTVDTTGRFTIHTLVYDTATLDLSVVEFGVTTGVDVLNLIADNEICASLDAAGAPFDVEECEEICEADAGTLVPDSTVACLDSSLTLTAMEGDAPVVPDGYSVLYVLTSGEDLVIEAVNTSPEFTVDTSGRFTIHTLVYDTATLDLSVVEFGVTTGVDVLNLIADSEICASLDAAGAPFDVEACDDTACNADAGSLQVANDDACLEDSIATLMANVVTEPTVPDGYSVIYVLTSGEDLVIQQVNDAPMFNVDTTGIFTIHTLVYDSTTLDLGLIEFGTTTGGDVLNLLADNDICAALDVAGAMFMVEECTDEGICEADAGSLRKTNVGCYENQCATYRARLTDQPVVPEGYEVLFVLTQGKNLVIKQVSDEPYFTVKSTGRYTIHTLVYDPSTLDLGIIEFGKTTGFDVNSLLVQGGGDICAALDVEGASAYIGYCRCEAKAGELAVESVECLENGGPATLKASVVKKGYLPSPYYNELYVLTKGDGLVIQAVSETPEFDVSAEGTYRIHSFVYNYNDLDLGIVQFGKTTGFDVVGLLQQGGGNICGFLDVEGARFVVEECDEVNLTTPKMYPNPVKENLNVEIPQGINDRDITIQILDAAGNLMTTRQVKAGTTNLNINVSEWGNGMYVIRFSYGRGQLEKKMFTKF